MYITRLLTRNMVIFTRVTLRMQTKTYNKYAESLNVN